MNKSIIISLILFVIVYALLVVVKISLGLSCKSFLILSCIFGLGAGRIIFSILKKDKEG